MAQTTGQGEADTARSSSTLTPAREKVRKNRKLPWPKKPRNVRGHLKFTQDHRARLPHYVSRFLGYRHPDAQPPYDPLPFPPFTWLKHIPLQVELWIFGWIGAFGGILLIEAIMSTSTAFRDVYHTPTIITSFGASAVLLFGVVESPVAQPRNFVLGHFVSALVGTCITRLFVLNRSYQGYLENREFHPSTFICGGLSMATSLLAQLLTGTVHPPAGATGLNAAVETEVVTLSWRYLPTVIASSLIMLGWALFINNLGRRRYPVYFWTSSSKWVSDSSSQEEVEENESEEVQALERIEEGQAPGDAGSTNIPPQELFRRLESGDGD